jgi:hypothetical protein
MVERRKKYGGVMADLHGLSAFAIRVTTPLGYILTFNAKRIDSYTDFSGVMHLDILAIDEPTPEPKNDLEV